MDSQILLWIGYLASGIIAASMAVSSIVKFRVINLVGASMFAIYGLLIGAFPVMLLNSFIVSVDIYFLYKIYNKTQLFDTLEVRGDNKYLIKFLDFHKSEILKFFPGFKYDSKKNTHCFFVLRDMAVTGIFLAHKESEGVMNVGLDYVIPEYRDFKNGKYVYRHLKQTFIDEGYNKIVVNTPAGKHSNYLKKIGFKNNGGTGYVMNLK